MKVAITDYTFPDLAIERSILEAAGHQIVAWKEKRPAAELPELVAEADVVITQFAPVTAPVIERMRQARAIVRYGIGVDNVDLAAARAKGIPVCNIPEFCIDEVADHTLAFILAATRQVVTNCQHVQGGAWGLAAPLERMLALRDLTVGIVGFGRIGREVAARLRPFKCRLLVHDPAVPAAAVEQTGGMAVELERLFAEADVVTLHCPSTPATRGLIDPRALARMKPGVILVNLARGDLVDSAALVEALASGQVSAAALDVFAPEPIPADHPILKLPGAILSAHVASASVRAVRTLRETAAHLAAAALRGERLPNVVNGVG